MIAPQTTTPRATPWRRVNRRLAHLVIAFLLVFSCEFAVMMVLPVLGLPEGGWEALIDSALLSVLVVPGLASLGLINRRGKACEREQDAAAPRGARRRILSLRNQYIVILIVLATGPLLWVGWSISREASCALNEEANASARVLLRRVSEELRLFVESFRQDALNITRYPPVSGLVRCRDNGGIDPVDGSTASEWTGRLNTLFAAYASSHAEVFKVRLLDEAGREWVRVQMVDGVPRIVPREELEDKSSRYYFHEAIRLPEGGCYISPLDLNVERGEIEMPHRPVIRAATPVWLEGRVRGVIVVSRSPVSMLARLQASEQGSRVSDRGALILAGARGDYLHHPDASKRWALQLGGNANIFRDWPALQEATVQHSRGLEENGGRILRWYRVPLDPDTPTNYWLVGLQWDRHALFHAGDKVSQSVAATSIGVGALALVVAMIIAAAWGRPVAQLASAANLLASGDSSVRVPETRHDELGDMARAFNRMAETIIRNTTNLKAQKDLAEQMNIELRSLNARLKEARDKAEFGAKAKSEFLANMSHEIRTPMTAILGFAETVLEADQSEEDKLNAIHTIRRNGDYLLSIINDILDLSKIEARKMTIEHIACRPCEIVAEVASLAGVRTKSKGLTFDVEYVGAVPETIRSDPTRLRQILINLIGNAIKFTEEGGVRLITRYVGDPRGPYMQFDVLDTGIGMSSEQTEKLFQPFTQADSTTTRKFGGTGLGLTISKRFAQMLGGDVTVIESREGVGTRFRVTVATGSLDGVRMLDDPVGHTSAILESASPATQDYRSALDGCRVLLAEDGADNQRLISYVLKKAGVDVTVEENGKLAVDAALAARDKGEPFDVILIDMQMPVMDGYEATALLRRKGYGGRIIALTAHAMASDRQKCLDAGCDDYTTKPINRAELIETIRAHGRAMAEA